jgi:hypothetical protein
MTENQYTCFMTDLSTAIEKKQINFSEPDMEILEDFARGRVSRRTASPGWVGKSRRRR